MIQKLVKKIAGMFLLHWQGGHGHPKTYMKNPNAANILLKILSPTPLLQTRWKHWLQDITITKNWTRHMNK